MLDDDPLLGVDVNHFTTLLIIRFIPKLNHKINKIKEN